MGKLLVLDVDDVLWELNRYICNRNNIDIAKITDFKLSRCSDLSESERNILYREYANVSNFKLPFSTGAERIKNLGRLGYDVQIISHALNERICMYKLCRLQDLGVSLEAIHVRNIGVSGHIGAKELPDGVFAFVDDNPYNILNSNAEHNILVRQSWNSSDEGLGLLSGMSNVRYCDTFNEVVDLLEDLG